MRTEREVRHLFSEHGLSVKSIRRNTHWIVKAESRTGIVKSFTVSVSPSDHRGRKNLEADMKRHASSNRAIKP